MAKGVKTGGRNWGKGQSGNPKGRPREAWAKALQIVGERTSQSTGKKYKEIVAEQIWLKALKGDLIAIKIIMDRMDGTPKQLADIISEVRPIPILQSTTKRSIGKGTRALAHD